MNYEVNRLALRAFYEKYSDEYIKRRKSGDKSLWDEAYKWQVLPELSRALSAFKEVNKDNANEILEIYIHKNPNQGTLIDWREADDLKLLVGKALGWQLLNDMWHITKETLAAVIDSNNHTMHTLIMKGKKFSPRSYGYLLAGKNPSEYPVFLQNKYDFLKRSLNAESDWRSVSLGQKYQLFTEATQMLGEWLKQENLPTQKVDGIEVDNNYLALDGQDFIYISEDIVAEK